MVMCPHDDLFSVSSMNRNLQGYLDSFLNGSWLAKNGRKISIGRKCDGNIDCGIEF